MEDEDAGRPRVCQSTCGAAAEVSALDNGGAVRRTPPTPPPLVAALQTLNGDQRRFRRSRQAR